MISRMKKFVFLCPDTGRDGILAELQRLGVVELTAFRGDLKSAMSTAVVDRSRLESVTDAWDFLLRSTTEEKDRPAADKPPLSPEETLDRVGKLRHEIFLIQDQETQIREQIDAIEPWGSFKPSEAADLGRRMGLTVQYFTAPETRRIVFPKETFVREFSGASVNRYLAFSPSAIAPEGCQELVFGEDLDTLRAKNADLEDRTRRLEDELHHCCDSRQGVYRVLQHEQDKVSFAEAKGFCAGVLDGTLAALQGWCPATDEKKLRAGLESQAVAVLEVQPGKDETVPTLLRNSGMGRTGEDLINIFDIPAAKGYDTSWWVLLSFTVFFAMIVSDAGYGLILLVMFLLLKWKVKKPAPAAARLFNLSILLSSATIVCGVLTGNYFSLPEHAALVAPLFKFRLFDPKDIPGMMNVSIVIGLVHITMSNLISAWRAVRHHGEWTEAFAKIGFVMMTIGFYFYYGHYRFAVPPAGADPMAYHLNKITWLSVLIGGAGFVFIMEGFLGKLPQTAGKSAGKIILAWLLHFLLAPLKGAYAIYHSVQQLFADVLSYLRIFALSLAGVMLAETFNSFVPGMVSKGVLGIAGATLILLVGHAVNLGLAILSATIHGLRLNFLEFYRWSFAGDGRQFRPFRLLAGAGK